MPLFEYKCPKCKTQFEKLIPHSQADGVVCECCEVKAERLLSTFGVSAAQSQAATMSPCAQARCETPSGMQGCHGGMCSLN
jgi:putative FmdB family regulatory protein